MAGSSCTVVSFLLYPSIFLILLFSSLNKFNYFPYSPTSNHRRNIFQENPQVVPINSININGCGGSSYNGIIVQKTKRQCFERMEDSLGRARASILQTSQSRTYLSKKTKSFVPRGSAYINPYAFHQSHVQMEKRFKVWTYKEGELPLFHNGPLKDIYSIEGQFINEFDTASGYKSPFLASHPNEALVYFLPVSITKIVQLVYERPVTNYSRERLQTIVKDYIQLVSRKHTYWNRSSGADHFFVACHDWGPDVSTSDPKFYKHFIRVLCNANSSEGFQPSRDVSLPDVNLNHHKLGPSLLNQTINDNRSILAFFAGGAHGYIRERMISYWKDKDRDIQVHEYLPKTQNYTRLMEQTKFCLCPSGYEVASPRVVESIYAGCVPVIISDHYVLPFSDVLDWSQFSVHIPVARIPEIKKILQGISMGEYLEKQKNVVQVQRHFVVNRPAKPYDVMHMVMHSVWLRRLNLRLPRV